MAKRMIDSDIFKKQRWFKQLKPEHKLAFFYFLTNCDHAGIWRIDILDLCEDCGFDSFDLQEFIEAINTDYDSWTGKQVLKRRFMIVHEKYLWMTGYIQYQYQGRSNYVNGDGKPVKSAFEILKGHNLLQFALDNYFIVLSKDQNNPLEGNSNPSEPLKREPEPFKRAVEVDVEVEVDKGDDEKKEKGGVGEKEKREEGGEDQTQSWPTFDDFWEEYDKKIDRPKAFQKWKKVAQKDREAIMAYIPGYKQAQPDKQFRKNPAVFLNNRSWENEVVPAGKDPPKEYPERMKRRMSNYEDYFQ